MLDARFSLLYFGPSLNTLQRGLPAIYRAYLFRNLRRGGGDGSSGNKWSFTYDRTSGIHWWPSSEGSVL